MSLPDQSIRRPIATAMVYLGVAVLGVLSFARLPIDLLPDVAFPTLSVWTTYSDAAPPEVERFITEPVEQEVSQVPGVKRVTSRSREGQSLVTLQFYWGTDMEFAALDVRERLDDLRDVLPRSVDRPVIVRSDPGSDPILTLAVSGEGPAELLELSRDVFARRLEQQNGVALASISGGREREIQVLLDPARLTLHGVTVAQVTGALDRANYQAPGGSVRRGRFRYSLRTLGQFTEVDQLRDVVVARPTGGTPVRLSDVAEVREGYSERQTAARYNGVPAVGLQIFKESGSNTVRVAERVETVLNELRAEFPSLSFEIATSQAEFIREAISNVVQALIVGGLLAFLVLFLFLRDPRYPVAVGLAIPISILAAFFLCYLFDVSLNVMSLGGLALGVGMLVDNSIVVLENVFRHRSEGRATAPVLEPGEPAGPRDAAALSAAEGSREVAGAITASTLTTIAVFGPVLYVRGVAGALFGDLSLAVAFSLLASLLVALTLLPVLAARFGTAREGAGAGDLARGAAVGDVGSGHPGVGDPGAAGRHARPASEEARTHTLLRALRFAMESVRLTWRDVTGAASRATSRLAQPPLAAFDRRFRAFADRYDRALAWALCHRAVVIGLAVAAFAAAISLATVLPRDLMPDVDERQFRVALNLPVGTPIEATDEAAATLEGVLLDLEAVDGVFTRVGRARRGEPAEDELAGLNNAVLEVRLRSKGEPTPRVVSDFRSRLARTGIDPGAVAIETGRSTALGRTLDLDEADLAVRIQGDELVDLIAVAESTKARLMGLPQLRDVRVGMQLGQPELEIEVDRDRAARYGLSVYDVASTIESYLRGLPTSEPFTEFSEKLEIRVQLPEEARQRLSDVLALRLSDVPLGEVVSVRQGYGPVEILREDQSRTVQVLAEVAGAGLTEVVGHAEARLEGMPRPPRTTLAVGGENEEMRTSFRSLFFAFGLALFLVYLILAAQFESLLQPVVVLVAVPLAAVGAVPALWLTGSGINLMTGIGLVILIGIVVNDAIVKVDFINQRRRGGLALRDAITEAGRLRLRPIVMTTATTVLGLIPLALGWGAGADLRSPLAIVVIGGLVSATFLTLIVVPVVYSLVAAGGEGVGDETVEAAPDAGFGARTATMP
ncbi:MAG: efflux RND transporter permease subunit [Gemmatimonadales bacterium]